MMSANAKKMKVEIVGIEIVLQMALLSFARMANPHKR
jgi:hypothetical protein